MKKLTLVLLLVMSFALAGLAYAQEEEAATPQTPSAICENATPAAEPDTREYAAVPPLVLEPGVDYYAVVCTPYGATVINLFETLAPKTVNNFVFLAESGFYNNLTFHRVMEDFMAQGGDPLGTGGGGPGYQFEDEFVTFMTFDRPGLLAMANSGPNTNGSQFFITTVVTDWLTYGHTIFGEVIDGQANVEAIPDTEIEPDVALETIVILTDRDLIDIDYAPPSPVTREELAEQVSEFPELLVEIDAELSGDFDTADFIALLPEALQEAAAEFFETYNHDYVVSVRHTNADCDLTAIPLEVLDYQIHVFATPDDARAASIDEALLTLVNEGNEAESIVMDFSGMEGQTWSAESICGAEDVTAARIYRQFGRFVVMVGAVYPSDFPGLDEQTLDGLAIELYDAIFFDAFRAEASQ